jgi:hypothetical protein
MGGTDNVGFAALSVLRVGWALNGGFALTKPCGMALAVARREKKPRWRFSLVREEALLALQPCKQRKPCWRFSLVREEALLALQRRRSRFAGDWFGAGWATSQVTPVRCGECYHFGVIFTLAGRCYETILSTVSERVACRRVV